jgi:hypothetical protein
MTIQGGVIASEAKQSPSGSGVIAKDGFGLTGVRE